MSATEAEERAQFTLAMRARGINDLSLLRALERAPRALFMPPRFADICGRDIALPIGCGQTSPPPSIVAAMIAALDLKPAHRVCEIGTGTGYCAALLAQLANTVVSLERFQTLALEAAARIKAFGLRQCRGAMGGRVRTSPARASASTGSSSTASIEPPGEAFRRLIAQGGVLVAVVAGPDRGEQRIVRLDRHDRAGGSRPRTSVRRAAMRPLEHGLARAL